MEYLKEFIMASNGLLGINPKPENKYQANPQPEHEQWSRNIQKTKSRSDSSKFHFHQLYPFVDTASGIVKSSEIANK